MRENLNAIKRLVAFTLTVLLLGTTIWNDVFVIATEENHCSEYEDEQTYAANILQPVGEGDGYCDHCGQVEQAHVHAEEPAPTEEVQVETEAVAEEEQVNEDALQQEIQEEGQSDVPTENAAVEQPENQSAGDTAAENSENTEISEDNSQTEATPNENIETEEENPEEGIEEAEEETEEDLEETEEEVPEEDLVEEEEECEHEWIYVSNGDGTHVKKCAKCGEESTEACTLDEEGKCALCGYEDESLVEQIYSKTLFGTTVTVSGLMPRGSWVEIYYAGTKPVEDIINDSDEVEQEVKALIAFDINIYRRSGEKYQPQEDGGSVDIRFSGVEEVEESKEEDISVYRIDDNDNVTEIECEVDGDEVKFEAEHFSMYAVVEDLSSIPQSPQIATINSWDSFAYIGNTGTDKDYKTLNSVEFYVYFPVAGTVNLNINTYKNLTDKTKPTSGAPLYDVYKASIVGAQGDYKVVRPEFTIDTNHYMTANTDYSVVVSIDTSDSTAMEECNVVYGADGLDSYIGNDSDGWQKRCPGIFQNEAITENVPEDTNIEISSIKDSIDNVNRDLVTYGYTYYGVGDVDTLTAAFNNPNVDRKVTWTIESGTDVIEILETTAKTCKIKAVAKGIATLKADFNGNSKTITVNVMEFRVGSVNIDNYSVAYNGQVQKPTVKGYTSDSSTGITLTNTYDSDENEYKNVNSAAKVVLQYTSSDSKNYQKEWTRTFKITPLTLDENNFPDGSISFTRSGDDILTMTGMTAVNGVTPVYNENKQDFQASLEGQTATSSGIKYIINIKPVDNFTGDQFQITVGNNGTKIDISTIMDVREKGDKLSNIIYTGENFDLTDRYDTVDSTKKIGFEEVEFIGKDELPIADGIITRDTADVIITDGSNKVDAKSAGAKKLTIRMKETANTGYTGEVSLNFTIKQAQLSSSDVTVEWTKAGKNFLHQANDAQVKPLPGYDTNKNDFVVKFKGTEVPTDQYTVDYRDNTKVTSNAKIILTAASTGNFTAERTNTTDTTFNIIANYDTDVEISISDGGTTYTAKNVNGVYSFTPAFNRLYDPKFVEKIDEFKSIVKVKIPGRSSSNGNETLSSSEYSVAVYDKGSADLNTKVGTKTIKITPSDTVKSEFNISGDGVISVDFEVVKRPISSSAIEVTYTAPTGLTYDGTEHEISTVSTDGESGNLKLYYSAKEYILQYGTDYTIDYNSTNTNAGTAKFTIKAKEDGNFSGSITKNNFKFTIGKVSLQDASVQIALNPTTYSYDGTEKTPEVTLTINGKTISRYVDAAQTIPNYTVQYSNNVNASTNAVVTVVAGTNGNDGRNLTGSKVEPFTITPQDAQIDKIILGGKETTLKNIITSGGKKIYIFECSSLKYTYDGKVYKGIPEVYIKNKATALERNVDYYVKYTSDPSVRGYKTDTEANAEASPYVRIQGRGNYTGTDAIVVYEITPVIIEQEDSKLKVVYDKKYDWRNNNEPVPINVTSVTYNGKTLTAGTDYVIGYEANNGGATIGTASGTAGEKTAYIYFKGTYAYKNSGSTEGWPLSYSVGIDLSSSATVTFENPFKADDTTYWQKSGGNSVRWINGYAPNITIKWKKANDSDVVTVGFYGGNGGTEAPSITNGGGLKFTDTQSISGIPKYDSRAARSENPTHNKITVAITPDTESPGQFYGSRTIEYDIRPVDVNSTEVTYNNVSSYEFNGEEVEPVTNVTYTYGDGKTYKLNTTITTDANNQTQETKNNNDYYLNPEKFGPNRGTYTPYICGWGNFTETSRRTFDITKGEVWLWLDPAGAKNPVQLTLTDTTTTETGIEKAYTAEIPIGADAPETYFYEKDAVFKPDLYCTDKSKNKLEASEYDGEIKYENNNVPSKNGVYGKATIKVIGNNFKTTLITVKFTIQTNDISETGYTATIKDFYYDAETKLDPATIKSKINKDSDYLVVKRGEKRLTYAADATSTTGDFVIVDDTDTEFTTWKNSQNPVVISDYAGTNNSPSVDDSVNYIWIKGINSYSGYRRVGIDIKLDLSKNQLYKIYTKAPKYRLEFDADNNETAYEYTGLIDGSDNPDELKVVIKYRGYKETNIEKTLEGENYTITRSRPGLPGPDRNIKVTGKNACVGTYTGVKTQDDATYPAFLVNLGDYEGISLLGGDTYAYTGSPVTVSFTGINTGITVEADKATWNTNVDNEENDDYTIIYTQTPKNVTTQFSAIEGGKWYAIIRAQNNSKFFIPGTISNSDKVMERYAFAIKYYLDSDHVNFTFDGGSEVGYAGEEIKVKAVLKTKDGKVSLYHYNTDEDKREYYVKINRTTVPGVGEFDIILTANPDNEYVVGSMTKQLKVGGVAIETVNITDNVSNLIYTGTAYTPEVEVFSAINSTTPLKNNVDYTVKYEDNVEAGTNAKIIVTGKDNYAGTIEKTFTIKKKKLDDTDILNADGTYKTGFESYSKITFDVDDSYYVGEKDDDGNTNYLTPGFTVKYGNITLEKGLDYQLNGSGYENNSSIATELITSAKPKIMITEISTSRNYEGSRSEPFTIEKLDISDANIVDISPDSTEYTGEIIDPYQQIKVRVPYNGKTSTLKKYEQNTDGNYIGDYTISVRDSAGNTVNNIKEMGTYKLVITGRLNCTGEVSRDFTVNKRSLADNYHYYYVTGEGFKYTTWNVTNNLYKNEAGHDETPGIETRGRNPETGEEDALLIWIEDKTNVSTGGDNKPTVHIWDSGVKNAEGKATELTSDDFTISVSNAGGAGTAAWAREINPNDPYHAPVASTSPAVTITGKGERYKDSITLPFNIGKNINNLDLDIYYTVGGVQYTYKEAWDNPSDTTLSTGTGAWPAYTYNGFAQTPAITVYLKNANGTKTKLTKDKAYTVSYQDLNGKEDNSVTAGWKNVIITGIGDYCGTKGQVYSINKKKITAVTDGNKAFTNENPMKTTKGELTFSLSGTGLARFTEETAKKYLVKEGVKEADTSKFVGYYYAIYDGEPIKPDVTVKDNTLGVNLNVTGIISDTDLDVSKESAASYINADKVSTFEYSGTQLNYTTSDVVVGFANKSDSGANNYNAGGNYYVGTTSQQYHINYFILRCDITEDFTAEFVNDFDSDNVIYKQGQKIEPRVIVRNGSRDPLVPNEDYEVKYDNNAAPSVDNPATVTIKGINNYQGTKTLTFIIHCDLAETSIYYYNENNEFTKCDDPNGPTQQYSGTWIYEGEPKIYLVLEANNNHENVILTYGKDYSAPDPQDHYTDNSYVRSGEVYYRAVPNTCWTGTKTVLYDIEYDESNIKVNNYEKTYKFTGHNIIPAFGLNISTAKFDEDEILYERVELDSRGNVASAKETDDFVSLGYIRATITYKIGDQPGTASAIYQITPRPIGDTDVKVYYSKTQRYTGRTIDPRLTINIESKDIKTGNANTPYELTEGKDYKVDYGTYVCNDYSETTRAGSGKFTLTGLGPNVTKDSTRDCTYEIRLQPVANLVEAKNTGESLSVEWIRELYADGTELRLQQETSDGTYKTHKMIRLDNKTNSYTFDGLKSSTSYRIVATAYADVNDDLTILSQPVNLDAVTDIATNDITVASTEEGKVRISWTVAGDVDIYYIYRSDDAESVGKRIAIIPESTGGYTNTKLTSGTQYYYHIDGYVLQADGTPVKVNSSNYVPVTVK